MTDAATKSLQLTGIGLRQPHYQAILETTPALPWLEVHSENFFIEQSTSSLFLEKIRQAYPISLHGVGLSLGSQDPINWYHAHQLKNLINRIQPCLVSEHLSWSSINGRYFHDLLPFPYTNEALEHLSSRIQSLQDFLQCQLIIENISAYVAFSTSEMSEAEFLNSLAQRTGCGILLDITNLFISSQNLQFDPLLYLQQLNKKYISEFHLAGFSQTPLNEEIVYIDSHDNYIPKEVWHLFANALKQFGLKPTLIEWDKQLPPIADLYEEAHQAETIIRNFYALNRYSK